MKTANNSNKCYKLVRSNHRIFLYNNIQLLLSSSLKQYKRGKGKRFENTNDIISWLKGIEKDEF